MRFFSDNLLDWYYSKKNMFPWRETTDPYKIWVSEIMLQQTQVTTVIPFYNAWIKKFPTLQDVANASDQDIFKYWEGLGYYKRANNLREACIQVLNNYKGEIPSNQKDLILLKGIGDYTSAAISSIAFNQPVPAIDGNVKRILSRILCLNNFSIKSKDKMYIFLSSVISKKIPGDFNQALMDLGREICIPKNPKCEFCPIANFCQSYKTNKTNYYPVKNNKSKTIPHYDIGVGIIWHNNKILITKRKKNMLLGGLWEFPGGKIKDNETIRECIKREIKEELNIQIQVNNFIMKINHRYSHFKITLHAHHCLYQNGEIKPVASEKWKWIKPSSFSKYPFPKANHYLFPKIRESLCIE